MSLLDLRVVILDVNTTHAFFFSAHKRAHTNARIFFLLSESLIIIDLRVILDVDFFSAQ